MSAFTDVAVLNVDRVLRTLSGAVRAARDTPQPRGRSSTASPAAPANENSYAETINNANAKGHNDASVVTNADAYVNANANANAQAPDDVDAATTVREKAASSAHAEAPSLTEAERARSIALMRVNHAGEIAAQALYQGQALFARDPKVREKLEHAASEELDHLVWTRERVHALGGRTSALDPLWYAGAFVMGAVAAAVSDRASLAFLEATETQVEAHLDSHLEQLPPSDAASRAIVAQMKADEAAHAQTARALGAPTMPWPLQQAMKAAAKVMTTAAAKI